MIAPSPEPGLMVPVEELVKLRDELGRETDGAVQVLGVGQISDVILRHRDLLDSLIAKAVPCGDERLVHWLRWALDTIDQYDEFLVTLGEPREKVYSAVHVAGKQKARTALSQQHTTGGE